MEDIKSAVTYRTSRRDVNPIKIGVPVREDGVEKAKEPKELFVIEGLTQAHLYDHVNVPGPKFVEFFGKALI